MAINSSVILLSSYDVPAAQATAATIGGNVLRFRIDQASVTNYSGVSRDLTVYLLQSGDAVIDLNKRIDALAIPANETVPLFELVGSVLETSGTVNAFASAASSLSLTINGTQFT